MNRVPIPSPVGGACSKVLPSGKAFANDRTPTAEELKKLIGDLETQGYHLYDFLRHKSRSMKLSEGEAYYAHQNQGEKISV